MAWAYVHNYNRWNVWRARARQAYLQNRYFPLIQHSLHNQFTQFLGRKAWQCRSFQQDVKHDFKITVSVLSAYFLGAVHTNAPALDNHDVLPVRMQLRQTALISIYSRYSITYYEILNLSLIGYLQKQLRYASWVVRLRSYKNTSI
jgi:hypothetical protein